MGKFGGLLFLSLLVIAQTLQIPAHQTQIQQQQQKIDVHPYLKNGYVVSLLPASSKENFIIDDEEKQLYLIISFSFFFFYLFFLVFIYLFLFCAVL